MNAAKTGSTVTLVGVGVLLAAFVSVAITGWALMLLLGVVHSYERSVPAVAYWPSVGITALLNLVMGIFKRGSKS